MAVGDMTYEDQMYNSNTVAYYKLGYLIYILFAILVTILVTNLLIGKKDFHFFYKNLDRICTPTFLMIFYLCQ
jgi:hypothetical protein